MADELLVTQEDREAIERGLASLRYVLNFADEAKQIRTIMQTFTLPERSTTKERLEALTDEIEAILCWLEPKHIEELKAAPRIGGNGPLPTILKLCDYGLMDVSIYGNDSCERFRTRLMPLGRAVLDRLATQHTSASGCGG